MESCHLCPFTCRPDEMFKMRRHLKEVHGTDKLPGHPRKSRWSMTPEEAENHRAALILKLLSPASSSSSPQDSPDTDTDTSDFDTSSHSLAYSPPSPMPSIGEEPDISVDFFESELESETESEPEFLPAAPQSPPSPSPCSVPALQVVPDSPEGIPETTEEEPQEQHDSGPRPRAIQYRFVTIQVRETTVYF